jgi:hypothetical protein
MLRQSVFGRLAGYEDVNDADRLGRDPAMRHTLAVDDGGGGTGFASRPSPLCYFARNTNRCDLIPDRKIEKRKRGSRPRKVYDLTASAPPARSPPTLLRPSNGFGIQIAHADSTDRVIAPQLEMTASLMGLPACS